MGTTIGGIAGAIIWGVAGEFGGHAVAGSAGGRWAAGQDADEANKQEMWRSAYEGMPRSVPVESYRAAGLLD